MKSTLDDLYFNGSLTALEECLKEFGQSVAGIFPLADGEMFGRIIGEIADDFDAAVNKRLLDIYAGNLLGGVRGVFGDTGTEAVISALQTGWKPTRPGLRLTRLTMLRNRSRGN